MNIGASSISKVIRLIQIHKIKSKVVCQLNIEIDILEGGKICFT
jgi:hypothetical protein